MTATARKSKAEESMTPTIVPERLERLDEITLISGHGEGPNGKVEGCVMDIVSWIAGEGWSDQPECASPVLTSFCIRLNDCWPDEDRQLLKPFIPRLVGTNQGREVDRIRAYIAADWAVRTWAPRNLRRIGMEAEAATLEALPPLTDAAGAEAARKVTGPIRDAAWEKRRKAWTKIKADAVAAANAAAVAVANAAADAVAVAAANAAANAVAAAVADAVAAAVAVADAVAAADAVADAVAVAAAAANAAAAAVAVAVADAVAAAAAKGEKGWSAQYEAAYKAAYKVFREKRSDMSTEARDEQLALLGRMIAVKAA